MSKWSNWRYQKSNDQVQNNHNHNMIFKDGLQDHNIFCLDNNWVEDSSITREPDFFKSIYLKRIPGQTNKDWFNFYVSIWSARQSSQVQFKSDTPIVAYHQHDQNSCFFSSLASALKAPNWFFAANEITTRISSSLTYATLDIIEFANAIMKYEARKN